MDNTARNRYELHNYVVRMVSDIMSQNEVPASMMEDALIDALCRIREVCIQELMIEADNHTHEDAVNEDIAEPAVSAMPAAPVVPKEGRKALERAMQSKEE